MDSNSIVNDINWENNSIIRRYNSNEWIYYVEGYRIAAEKLIDDVLNTKNERDTLIYPIFYLYRHYVEIQLKEIIQTGSKYLNDERKFARGHNLFPLWLLVKNIINEIWPSENKQERVIETEGIINSICTIDNKSDSFRYPFDNKGGETLKDITVINLGELKESMTQLFPFLNGVALAIAVYQDNKDEFSSI